MIFVGLFILAIIAFFIMILTAPRTTILHGDEANPQSYCDVTTIKDSSGGVWVTTTEQVVHD